MTNNLVIEEAIERISPRPDSYSTQTRDQGRKLGISMCWGSSGCFLRHAVECPPDRLNADDIANKFQAWIDKNHDRIPSDRKVLAGV